MRKEYLIGNWKMNLLKNEALNLVKETISEIDENVKTNIVFATPFIF